MEETLRVILSSYVFVAGCCSDSGRNLVAATAIGLVDSPAVELFVVGKCAVLLPEISCLFQDLCCVCRWACEFPCGEHVLPNAPLRGGHFSRNEALGSSPSIAASLNVTVMSRAGQSGAGLSSKRSRGFRWSVAWWSSRQAFLMASLLPVLKDVTNHKVSLVAVSPRQ